MANNYIKHLIPLVDAIAGTFGKNCEVVLHDLRKPNQSIIKIANGHITNRKAGDPLTDLGLSLVEKQKIENSSLIGYKTKTKKGAELKSTTVFFKDSRGKPIGALCINIDVRPYIGVKNLLEELCTTSTAISGGNEKESPEKFESNVDNLINELIEQGIRGINKPLTRMEKDEKLQIIHDLKGKGLFLIKGSAKRVSKELNVSLATIYKYLEEIQEV
jgi:predicted transcriptional regulator YheO